MSGNWGCGFFNGDPQLKLLIQWIAASCAGKKLHHCPYGFKTAIDHPDLFKTIRKMPIRKFYDILMKSCNEMQRGSSKKSIYLAIASVLKGSNFSD